jgi:hypothetical protein
MSQTTIRRAACALALVAALAGAGCGSDDDGGDAATTPSPTQFRAQTRMATTEISGIGTRLGATLRSARGQTDKELAVAFDDLAADVRRSVRRLRGLRAPAATRPKVTALSRALNRVALDLAAIARTARAHDGAAARAATQKLVRDSPAVRDANSALKKAVGVPVSAAPGTATTS